MKTVEKLCAQCELPMVVQASKLKQGRGKFCSKICLYGSRKDILPWNTGKKIPQLSICKIGAKNPMWKGGRMTKNGYILIKNLEHPNADARGYIREHRFVMEQSIGRILKRHEHVHHKDGDKLNNKIFNLELVDPAEHMRKHRKQDIKNGKKLFSSRKTLA